MFTPFFWNAYRQFSGTIDGSTGVRAVGLLVLFVVLEIVLHAVVALLAPADARTPKDERERLIEMRATFVAFQFLVVGALLGAATIHVSRSASVMQQVVMLSIVLAELVKATASRSRSSGEVREVGCAIRNRIRELRAAHGDMTQQALADRIGVTRQTVNAIELESDLRPRSRWLPHCGRVPRAARPGVPVRREGVSHGLLPG
ncbi:MAG: helix-turn-helix domain-containing protein [Vicinamibacterales bacterium]